MKRIEALFLPRQYQTSPDEEARQCKMSPNKRLACYIAGGWTGITALGSSMPARLLPKKVINHSDTREALISKVQMWT